MQVPTDSEMLLATLKMERRVMLAIPQLPSTFSADVAAITGASRFLRLACGHSNLLLVWHIPGTAQRLAACRQTCGKCRLSRRQSHNMAVAVALEASAALQAEPGRLSCRLAWDVLRQQR